MRTAPAPPRIRIGLAMPPKPAFGTLRQVLGLCRLLRLDAFLVWDHLEDLFPQALWQRDLTWAADGSSPHQFFDFQTTLGALARDAGRVRLGVGVTEATRRHPVVIAQAMLTLAHLTRRAPILGLGAGERVSLTPYGFDFTAPVGRLDEALQVIRLLFAGTPPLSFAGRHFTLDEAHFALRAPTGRTPRIWLGGTGPRLLRLTGQYGDGWYPTGALTPAEYATKLATIHAVATAASRDPTAIVPSFQPTFVAARTEREARQLLDHPVIRYLGLLLPGATWASLGHAHPLGPDYRGYFDLLPERISPADMRAAIRQVPVEALSDVGLIWGTPAQIIARLDAYAEAGARHFVPQLPALAISRGAAAYQAITLRQIVAHFRR